MGKYVQNKGEGGSSVTDALNQAEDEHYLDCPNADFWIRASATMLDVIFLFLLVSGIHRVFDLLQRYFFSGVKPETFVLFQATEIAVYALCFWLFSVWSDIRFGGSPAKLILGLRVVNSETGERLSMGRAMLREIIGKVALSGTTLGIGLVLPLFRKDNHALHDLISQSVVKKVRHER